MASKVETPAHGHARGVPVTVPARSNTPDIALEALRAQYLAEIFGMTPDTAVTIAELAFGEGASQ